MTELRMKRAVLTTLLCAIVFFFVMAIRPAPAMQQWDSGPIDWGISSWEPCTVSPSSYGFDKIDALELADVLNLQKFIPKLKKCGVLVRRPAPIAKSGAECCSIGSDKQVHCHHPFKKDEFAGLTKDGCSFKWNGKLDWGMTWRPCSVSPSYGFEKVDGLDLTDIRDLQRFVPELKKCEAWDKCLYDRDVKKTVKHCYVNDRRWR